MGTDRSFMSIALIGVIVLGIILGLSGIIAGAILIVQMQDPMAGSICLSIGSAAGSGALGTLGGVLAAPKLAASGSPSEPGGEGAPLDQTTQQILKFQAAVKNMAANVNPKQ